MWAINTLKQNQMQNRLPFVILLTDGKVQDEKEICKEVRDQAGPVRVLTFGIGKYCSWYFLKILALQTRGWSSGALVQEKIIDKIGHLVDRASQPILTHLELEIQGLGNVDLFPPQIPDLFIGGPLVIAGKYEGQMPSEMVIRGYLADGNQV